MAITKRGEVFHLRIRPFGPELITVRTSEKTKLKALRVEQAILVACRAGDYSYLSPPEREVCIRMFRNQRWEVPSDLGGQKLVKQELTLWKASEIFLNYPEIKDCKERGRYSQCLVHLVEHFGKNMNMKDIRKHHIKEYCGKRLKQGASPSTVNREKGTLSKMFQVLIDLEHVETNPAQSVPNESQKAEERQVYLSLETVTQIACRCPEWFRPIIWTAFYSGMRRGEILWLSRKNVKLTGRMIRLGPEDTKEGHWKRVPIHHELVPILEEAMKVSGFGSEKVFLLTDRKGTRPVGLEGAKNPWRRACEALKLEQPWPRFHDLRHTWRTNARRSKVDADYAEAIMGGIVTEQEV
jgi:integrase